MKHLWSGWNQLDLKLRLYETPLWSVLTFGCETWNLDKEITKVPNGTNNSDNRMIPRFTGSQISVYKFQSDQKHQSKESEIGRSHPAGWTLQNHIPNPYRADTMMDTCWRTFVTILHWTSWAFITILTRRIRPQGFQDSWAWRWEWERKTIDRLYWLVWQD